MPFWDRERVRENLHRLIVENADEERVSHSGYELRIGSEVFSSGWESSRVLTPGEGFSIAPGEFALIMTKEVVWIMDSMIAFLSVKFKRKQQGLLNVSGFHVDPGFHGPLIFSVLNVGNREIYLREGDPLFLIWFADLGGLTSRPYREDRQPPRRIPSELIEAVKAAQLEKSPASLYALSAEIKHVHRRLNVLIGVLIAIASVLGVLGSGIGVYLYDRMFPRPSEPTRSDVGRK